MATQIKLRRDTAANWTSTNPILALGEPGLETDTRKIKYGDGATNWNSLAYSASDASGSGFSGNYNDLTNKPTIPDVTGLATTSYVDNKPIGNLINANGVSIFGETRVKNHAYFNQINLVGPFEPNFDDPNVSMAGGASITPVISYNGDQDNIGYVDGMNLTTDGILNFTSPVVQCFTDGPEFVREGSFTVVSSFVDIGSSNKDKRPVYITGNLHLDDAESQVTSRGNIDIFTTGANYSEVWLHDNGPVTIYTQAERHAWEFGTNGTTTFPNNVIKQTNGANLSIATTAAARLTYTITNGGTGYGNGGSQSNISGGSGTGMIVNYGYGLQGQVSSIAISNFGTGYQNGDVLTMTAGNHNATFVLHIAAEKHYNWEFDTNGILTFPNEATLISATSGRIDLKAGLEGWAELASYNNDNYIWVDDSGAYIDTNYTGTVNNWAFDKNGVTTFPNNTIKQLVGANLSIATTPVVNPITITNAGSNYRGVGLVTAPTIGGSGTGLIVGYISNQNVLGEVLDIQLLNIGSGYHDGDVLTIDAGDRNATFALHIAQPEYNNWTFGSDGNVTFPDGSNQSTAYALDPYVSVVNSKISVTADINFPPANVTGVFVTVEGHGDYDTYFQQATGDVDGYMYAVGNTDDTPNYGIIYAYNPDGVIKWKGSISINQANPAKIHNLYLHDGFLYVGFTDGDRYYGVVKLSTDDGAVADSWVIITPVDSYPQLNDITIDSTGKPILVGALANQLTQLYSVATRSGGMNNVVFDNWDLQGYTSQSGYTGQWQIETNQGVFVEPDYVNSAYVPVTNLSNPSITGMIVQFRYDQNQTNYWAGSIVVDPGGYSNGDQLIVPGSLLYGEDGINDATWTYNGGILQGLAGTPSDALKNKTWFSWNSLEFDFTYVTTANLKTYLSTQAFVWTPDWAYQYGGTQGEQFYGVTYDSITNNIYITGNFHNPVYPYHDSALFKLTNTGTVLWSTYIEDDSGTSARIGSVVTDSSGNVITIGISNTNGGESAGHSLVTKLDTNGNIIWQVRQTNASSWRNDPRGAIDSNGDIYVTGSWYRGHYVVSVMKLSGVDGSLLYARFIDNAQSHDFGEFYDSSSSTTSIAGNNLYYGGYTYDINQASSIAIAMRLPLDGTHTGTYGRWIFIEDTQAVWHDCTSIAVLTTADYPALPLTGLTLMEGSPNINIDAVGSVTTTAYAIADPTSSITNVNAVSFADGSTQTTAAGGPITWTNPDNNTWRIETYNSGFSGYYDGGDYDAKWFDVGNAPNGSNQFRGAIIEYHAFFNNRGTMIGTIHISKDGSTGQSVTHTEHMSGSSDMPTMSLWETNGNSNRLYFKRTDGNSQNIMIQWTAKIFYGSESYC